MPTLRRSLFRFILAFTAMLTAGIAACGGGGGGGDANPPAGGGNPPPSGPPVATVLGVQLSSPWGMVFLPDGRMLVTQKAGSMVIVGADGSAVDATVGH